MRQLPHMYQHLYHTFYQQPIHHQEGIYGDGRTTHMVEEEEEAEESEEAESDDLKAYKAAVGVVEEATEDETNKKNKKMGLT